MPAAVDVSVADAYLDKISTGTALHVCSGTPATRTQVISQSLATVALTSADFTKGAGSPDGRRVTVAAKAGVPVTVTGTPLHYAVIDATVMLARTEVNAASPSLTQGSTTSIPATPFDVGTPVVV